MRRIILLSLFALLLSPATAQRRGGFSPSFARSTFVPSRAHFQGPRALGYGYSSGYGYLADYGYVPYDDTAPYAYAPQPVVLMQPPDIVVPPPTPAHAVITEYKASDFSSAPPPDDDAEPQAFTIVLKNGSTLSATTIVASEDGLHYVDPEERHLRISMASVDRAATQRLNRQKKLNLYLPAAQ
jgi:hypothetical protein